MKLEHKQLYSYDDVPTANNIKVSKRSYWNDDEWHFDSNNPGKPGVVINWKVDLGDAFLNDIGYTDLLQTCKCFLWSLSENPSEGDVSCKPKTLEIKFAGLFLLIKWMRLPDNNFYKLSDLDKYDIDDYVTFILVDYEKRGRKLNKASLHNDLKVLVDLYEHREKIPDSILIKPYAGESAYVVAVKNATDEEVGWIPHIPDEILKPLILEVEKWIDYKVADVIKIMNLSVHEIYEKDTNGVIVSRRNASSGDLRGSVRKSWVEVFQSYIFSSDEENSGSWRPPVESSRELSRLITDAVTACELAVLLFIGPRASELLSMQIDNISIRLSEDGDLRVFFLHGKTIKLEDSIRDVSWVSGIEKNDDDKVPLPIKAVQLLEELLHPWRQWGGAEHLFLGKGCSSWFAAKPPIRPCLLEVLNKNINLFINSYVDMPFSWHFSTHQCRKSFGRFVAKNGKDLCALCQHFLHANESMTDTGYVGTKFDLDELIDDQTQKKVAEALGNYLYSNTTVNGELGGRLEDFKNTFKELTKKQQAEELRWIVEDSGFVIHANDWGFCIDGGAANCGEEGGSRNQINICPSTCIDCQNFCVEKKHLKYWENRRDKNELIIESMSNSPASRKVMLNKRIKECDQIIEQLRG